MIEKGGDEDQAIAAMLHDAVEDGGGRAMLERIARRFGPRVAEIVEGCSDSVEIDPTEGWIERPEGWIQARAADEATELLDAYDVIALSIGGQSYPRTISDWLVEQAETAGRDRWPRERISLHGNPSDADVEQLDRAIAHHSQLRRSVPHQLTSGITAVVWKQADRDDQPDRAGTRRCKNAHRPNGSTCQIWAGWSTVSAPTSEDEL